MKILNAILFMAIVLFASGCASINKQQFGQNGEPLVWIKQIQVIRPSMNPDGTAVSIGSQIASAALTSPIQAATVGALAGVGVGMAGSSNAEGQIHVLYFAKDPGDGGVFLPGGGTILRKPWNGSSELQAKTWAILSNDKDGRILLPCHGCKPVSPEN